MKMIKLSSILLLCLCLLSGCVDQSQGSKTKDDSIVVTSVAVAEILDELEVDNVVGIPKSDSYKLPERYKDVKTVGAPMNPDSEKIKELNPSLILSPVSLENDLAPKYKNLKIDSAFLNLNSVEGMFKSIEELGVLLDKKSEANAMVDDFKTYMKEFEKQNEGKEGVRVLILMGLPGSYVVATDNSYVGNLVKLTGATNVYGDASEEGFANITPEDMLEKNPDIILRTSHAAPEQVKEMFAKEFVENDIWKHFDAVKNENVYDLDSKLCGMSANLKYKEALESIQKILYK